MKNTYFFILILISSVLFADNNIRISGNNNTIIVASKNITIDEKVYNVNEINIKIDGFPKEKFIFDGVITEAIAKTDPRIIDEIFIYSDDLEQVSLVKKWLKNPFSGYPRTLELYKSLIDKYKGRLIVKGNSIPLTILNNSLLTTLGRQTNKPLKPNEDVDEDKLLEALYNSWQEKNSN